MGFTDILIKKGETQHFKKTEKLCKEWSDFKESNSLQSDSSKLIKDFFDHKLDFYSDTNYPSFEILKQVLKASYLCK